ncbi:MAG: AsmA-like C-terminal region-containing protein [Tenuifilaceae bacterium]|jgi:hypothetical protein|nr:AsmA-like C-terminal region-containing protein [Bacteroidales bacterium]MDI9516320.1 AsmA-like C-terminal region-containing protein [Bacteroidota bacterium]NLH55277.1 AsmA-like C-terminal region-containing protein [Rikenellaceae bacterium]OQC61582.1 MAG: AsmA family protein [Bacteroidetes bacterium ADurb.Bin008]HNV81454.1 AsmA-like C-terminal region-containing protein [Tenuifilaceae bacterium]
MNKALKILLYLLIFILLILSVLGVVGMLFEEKLTGMAFEQLNKRINARVQVQDVKVSLIRGFPFATIIMKGVEITEGSLETPQEFESGLLSMQEVMLKIGLLGLIKNEYDIEELVLQNGWLNLYFDQKGNGNFEIFNDANAEKGNWLLNLSKLSINNITLSYIDPNTGWFLKGLVEYADFRGHLSPGGLLMEVKSKFKVGTLRQGNFYYMRNRGVNFKTVLLVTDNSIDFETEQVNIEKAKMAAKASFGRGIGSPVSMSISSKNMDINMLVSLLSQYNISLPSKTVTRGRVELAINLKGYNKLDEPFDFEMGFNSENLEIKLPDKPTLVIKDVSGVFTNGAQSKPETSEIYISKMVLSSGESTANGSLRIKNVLTPLYHLKINHAINLSDFKQWGVDIAPIGTGLLTGNFEALGTLKGVENLTISDFSQSKFNAKIDFENLSIVDPSVGVKAENMVGEFELFNHDITRASAKGLLNDSYFGVEFNVSNATALLFDKGKVTVNANIIIDTFDTNKIVAKESEQENSSERTSPMHRINAIKGNLLVNTFTHGKFTCKPLKTNFYLSQNQLSTESFTALSCNGTFSGNFKWTNPFGNEGTLSTEINVKGADIAELFNSFDSFGQSVVLPSNISGKLDGVALFSSPIVDARLNRKRMAAEGHFKIFNGRLQGVKELERLSRFVSLEELKDIHFETLENSISVENEEVIIPRMNIQSTALNLSLSGKHSFSGSYIYRTEVLLSDVLFSKATRNKAENSEFGEVEDDGSGKARLFLKLEGNENDFKVSYDGASAMNAFRENLRNERQTLINIFREEFGFAKKGGDPLNQTDSLSINNKGKDSLINRKNKPKNIKNNTETTQFKVEWDDE